MSTIEHPVTERTPVRPPHPERILLATDGGLAGLAAIRWVATRAADRATEVHVVQVVDDDAPTVEAVRATTQAKLVLGELVPRSSVRAEVACGRPIPVLSARSKDADLVVVGSNRIARGVPRLTASFGTRLAAWCRCPVVVVPRSWEPSAGPVVVGVAGDESDDASIGFAADEAARLGRELVLVHAWSLASVALTAVSTSADWKAMERAASDRLSDVVTRVRAARPDVRVAPVLGHDEPVDVLVRAERGASMVVVGTHGMTVIDRLLATSVSRGVLERPGCPVAVVPPPEAPTA